MADPNNPLARNPEYSRRDEGNSFFGFDAYTDPSAAARWQYQQLHGGGAKIGSTPAQRAGSVPGYVPGKGAVARASGGSSLTPQPAWDAQFQPRLHPMGSGIDPYAHGFVSNPPPMTNFLPGDSGAASLAPNVSTPSNWQDSVSPQATLGAAANYSNILASNRAAYAPGGMTQHQNTSPPSLNQTQSEQISGGGGFVTTSPSEVASIGARYGGGGNGTVTYRQTPGTVSYAGDGSDMPANVAGGNPKALAVKKMIPAVDNTSAGMDPYA